MPIVRPISFDLTASIICSAISDATFFEIKCSLKLKKNVCVVNPQGQIFTNLYLSNMGFMASSVSSFCPMRPLNMLKTDPDLEPKNENVTKNGTGL